MRKYLVNMNGFITIQVPVEANNEQEASEVAFDKLEEYINQDISMKEMEWETGDIFLRNDSRRMVGRE